MEYATLLTTQLDSQRLYYEDKIEVLMNQFKNFTENLNLLENKNLELSSEIEKIKYLNIKMVNENRNHNKKLESLNKDLNDEKEVISVFLINTFFLS